MYYYIYIVGGAAVTMQRHSKTTTNSIVNLVTIKESDQTIQSIYNVFHWVSAN